MQTQQHCTQQDGCFVVEERGGSAELGEARDDAACVCMLSPVAQGRLGRVNGAHSVDRGHADALE